MEKIIEKVKTSDFAELLGLQIINKGKEYLEFSTININRPGLQLTGFFEHFPVERIQIIGETEHAYLSHLSPKQRMSVLEKYFSYDVPCSVITTNIEPLPEVLICAEKYSSPLLRTFERTTHISNKIINYLAELLAPNMTMHGVLLDLHGVGVLITGESGIGKSETALELIQRGHRLVADDAVIIRRVNERLIGESPEIIRFFMEVRGIGIIDVRKMYGVGAVKMTKVIDMVVNLEPWDDNKMYDRLGLVQEYTEILDTKLPLLCVPIKPGRNVAIILEVAARNQRLKQMGYFAAEELSKRAINGDN